MIMKHYNVSKLLRTSCSQWYRTGDAIPLRAFALNKTRTTGSSSSNDKSHEKALSYWDEFAIQQKQSQISSSSKEPSDISRPRRRVQVAQPTEYQLMTSTTNFQRLSLSDLMSIPTLPKNSLLSTRDFIHASLYHPHYGYFSKKADIFSVEQPIPFSEMRDVVAFTNHVSAVYEDMDSEGKSDVPRQVWHTPTELFKPWYGFAVAEYIIRTAKENGHPPIIYEIGGGNGTLMRNIMDYLAEKAPELYEQSRYCIIEIASPLAEKQFLTSSPHQERVEIINQSILEWNHVVPESCFVIAMEVIDNCSHDLIRYDVQTGELLQGVVVVDECGDYKEAFEPATNPLLLSYMERRSKLGIKSPSSTRNALHRMAGKTAPFLPLPAMTRGEFMPTVTYSLFQVLRDFFPNHKLILSDFDTLPDTVPGYDTSPVAQTRYQGTMVACSTYLVQPGWFDIFFPTDFESLSKIYTDVMNGKPSTVRTHASFCKEFADLSKTRLRDGENPMLTFYENMKFLIS